MDMGVALVLLNGRDATVLRTTRRTIAEKSLKQGKSVRPKGNKLGRKVK
jgi:hypothetical protein